MNKLLTANFARLRKNQVFIFSIVFMFVIGILFPLVTYQEMIELDVTYYYKKERFGILLFLDLFLRFFAVCFWERTIQTIQFGTN